MVYSYGKERLGIPGYITSREGIAIVYLSNYKHEAIRVTYKLLPRLKMMSRCNEGEERSVI